MRKGVNTFILIMLLVLCGTTHAPNQLAAPVICHVATCRLCGAAQSTPSSTCCTQQQHQPWLCIRLLAARAAARPLPMHFSRCGANEPAWTCLPQFLHVTTSVAFGG
mmetsp:Transcript_36866/g.82000  ORF Transcript_36866/g.82000 Transcript_36866/m.82000 type:complete len:107 (-) Transcript_36866:558-878(-)